MNSTRSGLLIRPAAAWGLSWLLSVWAATAAPQAASVIPANSPPSAAAATVTRYLFVVDTSASMSRYAGSTYRALEQFIDTGLQGQMRAGEAFDVWCFNDQVFANRLTPFVWDPPLHQALANTAIKGVKAQRFERTARFDRLLVALNQTARTADPLTIVLFTDGTELIKGTPFDAAVNDIYQKYRKELRRSRKPFVTTVVMQQGQFVAYTVNSAGLPIAFDELARYLPPAPVPATAQTATNSPPPPPAPSPVSQPPEIKPIAQPLATNPVPALAEQPPLAAPVVTPAVAVRQVAPEPAPTNEVAAVASPKEPVPAVATSSDLAGSVPDRVATNEIINATTNTNVDTAAVVAPPKGPPPEPVPASSPTPVTPMFVAPSPSPSNAPVVVQPAGALVNAEKAAVGKARLSTSAPVPLTPKAIPQPPTRAEASSQLPLLPAPARIPPPPITNADADRPHFGRREYLFGAGIAALMLGGLLVVVLRRRRIPKNASFISRSIERELR